MVFGLLSALTSSWCLSISKARFKPTLHVSSFPLTPFGNVLFCISDSAQMLPSLLENLIL